MVSVCVSIALGGLMIKSALGYGWRCRSMLELKFNLISYVVSVGLALGCDKIEMEIGFLQNHLVSVNKARASFYCFCGLCSHFFWNEKCLMNSKINKKKCRFNSHWFSIIFSCSARKIFFFRAAFCECIFKWNVAWNEKGFQNYYYYYELIRFIHIRSERCV